MRFVLDNDVDARVRGMLIRHGHECWTASQANLAAAADDSLTIYADERDAVVVTHDKEFSERRRRNAIGRHLHVRCAEYDALELLEQHLDEVVTYLALAQDIFVAVSVHGVTFSRGWA